MLKNISLSKELGLIIVVKIMLLILIKIIWFSAKTDNIEQSISQRFLARPSVSITQEK